MDLSGSIADQQDSFTDVPDLPICEGHALPAGVVPAVMQLALDAWEAGMQINSLTNMGEVSMAEAPARANAAQLAARKIKLAKPKRGTNRSTPDNAGDAAFSIGSQFGGANPSQNMFGGGATNGGGLFGGGFNPPSSGGFDFQANVPQMSFGTPVTNPSQPGQGSYREDTTGEEAARRSKAFRTDEADKRTTPFAMNFGGASQQPAQPASNLFSSGNNQAPAASAFSFGQTATQPTTNSFSFGNSQPSPSFQFGQKSQPSQNAVPATNMFAKPAEQAPFGTQPSQSSANLFSSNIFGKVGEPPASTNSPAPSIFAPAAGPTSNGASSSFTFGQNSTPAFSFGQKTPEPTTPSSASFTFGQQTAKPVAAASTPQFGFGQQSEQAPAPASKPLFSFGQTTTAAPTASGTPAPLFGQKPNGPSSPAPSQSLFNFASKPEGVPAAIPAPTSSLFNFPPKAAETPAAPKEAPTSVFMQNSSNLFNTQPTPTASAPATGVPPLSSSQGGSTNMFQQTAQSSSTPKSLFSPAPTSNLFQPPATESPAPLQQQQTIAPLSNNVSKQNVAPNPGHQSTSSGIFSSLPNTPNIFAQVDASKQAPPPSPKPAPKQLTNGATNGDTVLPSIEDGHGPKGNDVARPRRQMMNDMHDMADFDMDRIEALCPPRFNEVQRIEFYGLFRVRRLNEAFKSYVNSRLGGTDSFMDAVRFYTQTFDQIAKECDDKRAALKRKADDAGEPLNEAQAKRQKPNGVTNGHDAPATVQRSPEKRIRQTTTKNVFTSPKKSTPAVDNSTTPKAAPPSTSLFAPQPNTIQKENASKPAAPPKAAMNTTAGPSLFAPTPQANGNAATAPLTTTSLSPAPAATSSGKRKAEKQITKDDPFGEEEDIRSRKIAKPTTSTSGTSNTMNRFKDILEKSEKPKFDDRTPAKSNPFASLPVPASTSKAQETPAPRNPFAALPIPATAPPAATSKQPTFGFTPAAAASTATSNIFGAKSGPEISQTSSTFKPLFGSAVSKPSADTISQMKSSAPSAFAPKAASSSSTTSAIKPPTFGSAGPVDFLAQFGAQAQKDKADAEAKAMQRAKDEDMDSDDDEAEWEAQYKAKREVEKKALDDAAKNRASYVPGKGFVFAPGDKSSDKTADTPAASKPLFGQSAPTSTPNIFGSTTSSAPKTANVFGQSSSGPSTTSSIFAPTTKPAVTSSIFGQSASGSSSLFAPPNRSETSSPAAGSSTGSVFDSQEKRPPVTFGNVFAQNSNGDSGDNGDDESTEADNEDDDQENTDPNEEKKDPTYSPEKDKENEPKTPGTPVEETGPGIASVKKPSNLFNFTPSGTTTPNKFGTGLFGAGQSASGTSTPGGLFDRIAKDGNGNPIRKVPAEDKENSGPAANSVFGASSIFSSSTSGSNPFGGLGKNPAGQFGSGGDNTWKQSSPIKFGASTTAPPATPSVNVTAATPEKPVDKPSPFAGLFGNTTAPKPSLFAGLNGDKPAASAGFKFGGGATPASSSLLASAVASGVTSRATTPGATTDGESANEANDPDAENHEQVDLLSSAAGEEDEDVMFTIRTKALQFVSPKDGEPPSWVTKGLGPLKVLKHKTSGASRVLLRADPSGTVVLNKSILGKPDYKATKKTVTLLTADESGKGLETWLLQVKTEAMAEELAKALQENKGKA